MPVPEPNILFPKLHPQRDFNDKENWRVYFVIGRDGKTYQKIVLDVRDKTAREEIIYKHFLTSVLGKDGAKEVSLVGRDDPWDFSYTLANGEEGNIEITAFAEEPEQLQMTGKEQSIDQFNADQKIAKHKALKHAKWFQHDPGMKAFLDTNRHHPRGADVANPFYSNKRPSRMFTRMINFEASFLI